MCVCVCLLNVIHQPVCEIALEVCSCSSLFCLSQFSDSSGFHLYALTEMYFKQIMNDHYNSGNSSNVGIPKQFEFCV